MTNYFENALRELDIEITEPEGLVLTDRAPEDYHEYIAIEHARRYKATAVYFRRFSDGRPPVPQIYIYDYTSEENNDEEIASLYKQLWNAGQVPLFFIFTRTEIKIFNCLEKPFDKGQFTSSPLEIIKLASEVEEELNKKKEFSARNFDNGSFWETSEYKDHFKIEESAYETLLRQLNITKKQIIKHDILPEAIAKRLLVMAILIKYLEERKDERGNTVFPKDFFNNFSPGAEKFTDILREKGACVRLFDELSRHFNGEIFKLDEADKEKLLATDLNLFAGFLEGIEGNQATFWPLYSFNDLPIELISNIYEDFLGDIKGVVYTPPYLVNFLIDETMPLDKPKSDFKVLDPACGSGIFLVAAYRRLIYWWRIQNNWKKPDLEILKKILRENIYGIDIEIEAIQLSLFSISLALCDELSPKVIWEELKFDNLLKKNFFPEDFFELIDKKSLEKRFDLIIGNPPFISKLTTPSAEKLENYLRTERFILPDRQLALLFLLQSMLLCKKEALTCLILPSAPFLYNEGSFEFRKKFSEKYHVVQILDFTCLQNALFNKQVATIGLFVKNEEPSYRDILHVTVRRTKTAKEKLYFELDYYDFHRVSCKEAMENRYVWKCNLLGGGRLKHIINRLSSLRKLGEFIKEKEEKDGWVSGEGYIIGNREEISYLEDIEKRKKNLTQNEHNDLIKLQKKYKKADYLTGKRNLPTEAFTEKGIDESKINILNDEYFYRICKKEIFTGPHVLIKEHETIPVEFREDDLTFKHGIIGIHAPENQVNDLKQIVKRAKNNKLYPFYIATSSSSYLIRRQTALDKADIDNLPYTEDKKDLERSAIENILIDDVLEYMTDFCKHGEGSKILQKTNEEQLKEFGKIYCEILNSVYKEFKAEKPLVTHSFIYFPFYYGERPLILEQKQADMEKYLNKLIVNQAGKSLKIIRILRIYEENIIYLIKPDQIRYWMKSIAVRDADETFADLVKQGY